ncbi:hypothetical protein BOTCAL_0615g00030 [Botryotinia calthae]|uniref:Uncharacterized protein n=1 Tax=Botryotinia calthae TaxID=38488 RepID=A0A4Y8CL79_9HELO|nr:hypothetical protein BOTCAL_0615g00030 [Botryotinia calthae]
MREFTTDCEYARAPRTPVAFDTSIVSAELRTRLERVVWRSMKKVQLQDRLNKIEDKTTEFVNLKWFSSKGRCARVRPDHPPEK